MPQLTRLQVFPLVMLAGSTTNLGRPMQAVVGLFAMSADTIKFVFRRPFQWREFLEQSCSVSWVPPT